ncbi:sensor histidine kinase [Streptomyces sp. NPDC086787]|uniref:sensor histidine kinase n=1 Tax=Streptomyces sp. NPDC086787 TaxID=3365759 RepID=UPI0037FD6ED9
MDRSSQPHDAFAEEGPVELSPRVARALWSGSAGAVLAVLGTSVLVTGAEHGRRLPAAVVLVLAQTCVLRWQARAPGFVLAVNAATGLAVWVMLPEVTLTGALFAAQVTLCVLSATRPRRVAVRALAVMCLPAPLAFAAGGGTGLAAYLPAVVLAWTAGRLRRAQQARTRAETRRAVVEERARITREVHDVVAHTLSVMIIQAGAADDVFTQRPEQARQALRAIDSSARSALGELRMLLAFRPDEENPESRSLEPESRPLEPRPSLGRLDELADAVSATGMTVRVHRETATDELPATVDSAAYRIVQEALTNTLRHALGADEANVYVTSQGEGVKITVIDNGRTAQARSATVGERRGLAGMTDRARLVGGSLNAGPLPQGGFEVTAWLPTARRS